MNKYVAVETHGLEIKSLCVSGNSGTIYPVSFDAQNKKFSCDCKGFKYRANCGHIKEFLKVIKKKGGKMVEDTSIIAYHELKDEGKLGARQKIVLETIKRLGAGTDMMIARHLNQKDPNFVRPRRKELLDKGLIFEVQKSQCPITGKLVKWWKVVPKQKGLNAFMNAN